MKKLILRSAVLGMVLSMVSLSSMAQDQNKSKDSKPDKECTHGDKKYGEGSDHPGNSDKECEDGKWVRKD